MRHEVTGRALAAAVGALLLCAQVGAQQREYFIKGKVVDTKKQPIAGVQIRLLDPATSRAYTIKTDKDGVFKFAGLPHATYEATFSCPGYAPKQDQWKFATPQDTMQRVEMPDVVLLSQAQVEEVATLKETEAGIKEAAETLRGGDTERAIARLQALLEKRPDDVNALFLLGLGYGRKGQCADALAPLTRVTELSPRFAGAWFELGVCQRQLGAADRALAAYDKALELAPANTDAAYNAGLLLFEAGRTDEALARFEQALALKPDDADLLDMAARCCIQQAKYARALELLQKARASTNDPAKVSFLDEMIAEVKQQLR